MDNSHKFESALTLVECLTQGKGFKASFVVNTNATDCKILALVLHLLDTSDDTTLAPLPVSVHSPYGVATVKHMHANMHSRAASKRP